jgi:16S rRNA processing protein RimM
MQEDEGYRHIGKIAAAHGLQGLMLMIHELGKKHKLQLVSVVFIELSKNNLVPFFIEQIESKDEFAVYLKTEEVHNRTEALTLVGKKVWLKEEAFLTAVSADADIRLVGYLVFHNSEPIGQVQYVSVLPQQKLLAVNIGEKEALLPLHKDTLIKIDDVKKEIFLRFPEGLLEVFL